MPKADLLSIVRDRPRGSDRNAAVVVAVVVVVDKEAAVDEDEEAQVKGFVGTAAAGWVAVVVVGAKPNGLLGVA